MNGFGILISGPSGAGKSDLALRLIDGGAKLVADDRVRLLKTKNGLKASAPEKIKGFLEIRGLGIVEMPFLDHSFIALKIALRRAEKIKRMPEPAFEEVEGVSLPLLELDPSAPSAAARIKIALDVFSYKKGLVL